MINRTIPSKDSIQVSDSGIKQLTAFYEGSIESSTQLYQLIRNETHSM